jgi:hypothetical protein
MVVKFRKSSQTGTDDYGARISSPGGRLIVSKVRGLSGSPTLSNETYQVECKAKSTGLALNKICNALRSEVPDSSAYGNRKKCFTEEENSIHVPCVFLIGNAIVEIIKNKTGVRACLDSKYSLGHYLDGGDEDRVCPTFFGSFRQLNEVLRMVASERGGKRCSLRVCAPRDDNLLRLLAATQHCQDNPGILGVDIDANAYFAVKTIGDMKILLSRLASNDSTDLTAQPRIEVVELTYPKGVF